MSQIKIDNIVISRSRMNKLLSGNKKIATSLVGWDRFLEIIGIRTRHILNKKEKLKELWTKLHKDPGNLVSSAPSTVNINFVSSSILDKIVTFAKMRDLINHSVNAINSEKLEFKLSMSKTNIGMINEVKFIVGDMLIMKKNISSSLLAELKGFEIIDVKLPDTNTISTKIQILTKKITKIQSVVRGFLVRGKIDEKTGFHKIKCGEYTVGYRSKDLKKTIANPTVLLSSCDRKSGGFKTLTHSTVNKILNEDSNKTVEVEQIKDADLKDIQYDKRLAGRIFYTTDTNKYYRMVYPKIYELSFYEHVNDKMKTKLLDQQTSKKEIRKFDLYLLFSNYYDGSNRDNVKLQLKNANNNKHQAYLLQGWSKLSGLLKRISELKVQSIKPQYLVDSRNMQWVAEDLGEDLSDFIKKNIKSNRPYSIAPFKDLILDLEKLHELKIVHRDIKPKNLFFKNNKIYLTDLDSMGAIGEIKLVSGTPFYGTGQLIRKPKQYGINLDKRCMLLSMIIYLYGYQNIGTYDNKTQVLQLNQEIVKKFTNEFVNEDYRKTVLDFLNDSTKDIPKLSEMLVL